MLRYYSLWFSSFYCVGLTAHPIKNLLPFYGSINIMLVSEFGSYIVTRLICLNILNVENEFQFSGTQTTTKSSNSLYRAIISYTSKCHQRDSSCQWLKLVASLLCPSLIPYPLRHTYSKRSQLRGKHRWSLLRLVWWRSLNKHIRTLTHEMSNSSPPVVSIILNCSSTEKKVATEQTDVVFAQQGKWNFSFCLSHLCRFWFSLRSSFFSMCIPLDTFQ